MTSERWQPRIDERLLQSPRVSSLELILYQENPFIDSRIKNAVLSQYTSLPERSQDHRLPDKKEVRDLFRRFVFDPGLDREHTMQRKVFTAINKYDTQFKNINRKIKAFRLYNRSTFIRIAKGKIIEGKHIGFINFDLKNIRQADNADYAEHLLRYFRNILREVCKKYQVDPEAVTGRVGGDEFSILFSSGFPVTENTAEEIYNRVKEAFEKIDMYYAVNDLKSASKEHIKRNREFQVKKSRAELKKEKRTTRFIIPQGKEEEATKRKILIHALQFGQMPDGEILAQENRIGGKAFEDYLIQERKKITSRFIQTDRKFDVKINRFFSKHPEFPKQRKLIEKLRKEHPVLARALFISLVDYLTDPLLREDVYPLPDFLNYLACINTPGTIIRYTNPFTKCFNAEYLYTGANKIIRNTYELVKSITHQEGGVNPIYCRAGGDILVFIPQIPNKKYYKNEVVMLPVSIFVENEKDRFTDGFPLCCSTVEFFPNKVKGRGSMKQLIENIDYQNSMLFIGYLNDLFKNPKTRTRAKKILDFYISQRTEERLNNLSYWINKAISEKRGVSIDLFNYIISRSHQLQLELNRMNS